MAETNQNAKCGIGGRKYKGWPGKNMSKLLKKLLKTNQNAKCGIGGRKYEGWAGKYV